MNSCSESSISNSICVVINLCAIGNVQTQIQKAISNITITIPPLSDLPVQCKASSESLLVNLFHMLDVIP